MYMARPGVAMSIPAFPILVLHSHLTALRTSRTCKVRDCDRYRARGVGSHRSRLPHRLRTTFET